MSALTPLLTLDETCEQAQNRVCQELINAGFRIMLTFDLQVARMAHQGCSCPHHGTEDCNCQMVILLVYQEDDEPATLVIHGQENKSLISFVPEVPVSQRLEATIQQLLQLNHSIC
jgi:hypothetical protein